MNWQEAFAQAALQNLLFKIKLNRDGEVIINAMKVNHALYAWKNHSLAGAIPPESEMSTRDPCHDF